MPGILTFRPPQKVEVTKIEEPQVQEVVDNKSKKKTVKKSEEVVSQESEDK